jgi:hypothetical protein
MRNACRILVGKPGEERSLGRPRRRWEDIRMYLREIRWEGVWLECIWLRIGTSGGLLNTVINHRVP